MSTGASTPSGPAMAPCAVGGSWPSTTWASPSIEQRSARGEQGVFVTAPVAAGEVLVRLGHTFTDRPGRYTLQLDEGLHHAGAACISDYLNHACQPTCAFYRERLEYRALKALQPGDEVTFNYLTTELELAEPFACQCGAGAGCFGEIRGFAALRAEQQEALRPWLTPYLEGRLRSDR